MADKAYATLPRLPYETDWEASHHDPETRKAIEDAMEYAAKHSIMTLCNRKPEAGWETNRHSRDGKWWPCPPTTAGARPVWLWAARK